MNEIILSNLKNFVNEERIHQNESLAAHTTFRVGGNADCLIDVETQDELCKVTGYLEKIEKNYFILGNGSNILVSDNGYDGVVIRLGGDMKKLEVNDTTIVAGGGVSLQTLCKAALDNSLTGLEFAYGIPGTVGGAMVMNAGAYDGEMADVTDTVEVVSRDGDILLLEKSSMEFGYRTSAVKRTGHTVTRVWFSLKKGNHDDIEAKMKDFLSRRKEKQPLEYPSAGSTFKRPEGYYAGKLIMDAGLAGRRIGGASVSEKHCGFIINDQNATASDVNNLISLVITEVYENSGVRLEPEVIRIGDWRES